MLVVKIKYWLGEIEEEKLEDIMREFNNKPAFFINQQATRRGDLLFFDVRSSLPPVWIIAPLSSAGFIMLGWYWGLLFSWFPMLQLVAESSRFQYWALKTKLKKESFIIETKLLSSVEGLRGLLWGKI